MEKKAKGKADGKRRECLQHYRCGSSDLAQDRSPRKGQRVCQSGP